MSLIMLMPILKQKTIENAIESVLDRLNDIGEVAHEEDIGDFSDLEHLKKNQTDKIGTPIYDYKMVDDDFMLLPIVESYLLENTFGKNNIKAFLDKNKKKIVKNMNAVIEKTIKFHQNPVIDNLIRFKDKLTVGNW